MVAREQGLQKAKERKVRQIWAREDERKGREEDKAEVVEERRKGER